MQAPSNNTAAQYLTDGEVHDVVARVTAKENASFAPIGAPIFGPHGLSRAEDRPGLLQSSQPLERDEGRPAPTVKREPEEDPEGQGAQRACVDPPGVQGLVSAQTLQEQGVAALQAWHAWQPQ